MSVSLRMSRRAPPRTASARPYIGEVSKKRTPARYASSTIRCAFATPEAATSSVRHVPIPTTGTTRPVVPSRTARINLLISHRDHRMPSPTSPARLVHEDATLSTALGYCASIRNEAGDRRLSRWRQPRQAAVAPADFFAFAPAVGTLQTDGDGVANRARASWN